MHQETATSTCTPAATGGKKGGKTPSLGKNSDLPPYQLTQGKQYKFGIESRVDHLTESFTLDAPQPVHIVLNEDNQSWNFEKPQKPPVKPTSRKNLDFRLQHAGACLCRQYYQETQENLQGSSMSACGVWEKYKPETPGTVELTVRNNKAKFSNLFYCQNVWSCPLCGRARAAQQRSWLRAQLFPCLTENGYTGSLITLTMSHKYDSDWGEVVEQFLAAFRLWDRRMNKVYALLDTPGKLRALEAPVGQNGIHPHIHFLLIHKKNQVFSPALLERMESAWHKAVEEVGSSCNEHGFDFQHDKLDTYLAKLDAAFELSAHDTKSCKRKGRTLNQLLLDSKTDPRAGEEWIRAVKALAGHVRFHAGNLPKKLGIPTPSEWSEEDDEATKDVDSGSGDDGVKEETKVEIITYKHSDHLKATGTDRPALALIARAARTGGQLAVDRMVSALCRYHQSLEDARQFARIQTDEAIRDHLKPVLGKLCLRPWQKMLLVEAKRRKLNIKVCKGVK